MASLRIVQGPAAGTLLALTGEQAVLGRHPSCDLVLDSLAVSRWHARVCRRGGRLALDDLDSSSGTYLNGHQIRGPLWLAGGDLIQIGPYHIALEAPPPGPLMEAE